MLYNICFIIQQRQQYNLENLHEVKLNTSDDYNLLRNMC